jgi:hypothetical protein
MIATAVLLAMALDLTSLHPAILADAQRRSGSCHWIRVVHSEAVTWRWLAGCPGRDGYTQALIRAI